MKNVVGVLRRMRRNPIFVAILSLAVISLIIVGVTVAPKQVAAAGAVQIAPVVNEVSDGLASNVATYSVFSDTTTNYSYSSGPVTLSTCQDGSCTIVADDALKLTVTRPDGTTWTKEWDFYTHDQPPADVTAAFQAGNNVVRAQLIDLVGPLKGSPRPFYLVSAAPPAPAVTVTVTKGANFISTDPADSASLYLHIHVARSDGTPVSGAQVGLSNSSVFLAGLSDVTDSNGNLTAPVTLPPGPLVGDDPVTGDVSSSVVANVNGQDYSSAPLLLYHGERLDSIPSLTLTADEAAVYNLVTMGQNASQPDPLNILLSTCASDLGLGNRLCDLGVVVETIFSLVSGGNSYNPQANDQLSARAYEYTSPGVTSVYLLYTGVVRGGKTIFNQATWTESGAAEQNFVQQQWWNHTGMTVQFDSPVTGMLTDPSGKQVGWDPAMGKPVYDEFGLVSSVGSEPYELFIPAAAPGQYTLKVTGTAAGSYTLSAFGLDANGNSSVKSPIHGTTLPGYTDTYFLTYPATAGEAIFVQRKVSIDIKPGETGGGTETSAVPINVDSSGLTPVAILSTPTFDARTVDPKTVAFGPAATPAAHCAIEDVNGDGLPDMMCHFKTNQSGIVVGQTLATVIGKTVAGVNIIGWGDIWTVPQRVGQVPPDARL